MTLRILIADDEKAARYGMAKALAAYRILEAEDAAAALAAIRNEAPDLVFLDLNMPGGDGRTVLRQLAGSPPTCRIVVVTASDSVPIAVECLRLGASDYVTKPFEVERIRGDRPRVRRTAGPPLAHRRPAIAARSEERLRRPRRRQPGDAGAVSPDRESRRRRHRRADTRRDRHRQGSRRPGNPST
jgi:CheY-like chemotaxis protein